MLNNFGKGLLASLDVAGFSHLSGATFDDFYHKHTRTPQLASECCSCRTQRGQPFAADVNQLTGGDPACISQQVNMSDSRSFVAGSFVWTLHDYYGEVGVKGQVNSAYGQFDVASFPKAAAYWFESTWLAGVASTDAGRSPLDDVPTTVVHLLQDWDPRPGPNSTHRAVQVPCLAPFTRTSCPETQPSPSCNAGIHKRGFRFTVHQRCHAAPHGRSCPELGGLRLCEVHGRQRECVCACMR